MGGAESAARRACPPWLGWTWHQIQQRPGYGEQVNQRVADVQEVYGGSGTFASIEPILDRYHVELIYVGDLERALYGEQGLAKFSDAAENGDLEIVYGESGVGDLRLAGRRRDHRPGLGRIGASGVQRSNHAYRICWRGSSASRSPSPRRLLPMTTSVIAMPGYIINCGALRKNNRPSLSIVPHSGVGGCAPRPRKLTPEIASINAPSSSVARTMTDGMTLGRT